MIVCSAYKSLRRKERKKENGYAETERREKVLGQGAVRVPGGADDRLVPGGGAEPAVIQFAGSDE